MPSSACHTHFHQISIHRHKDLLMKGPPRRSPSLPKKNSQVSLVLVACIATDRREQNVNLGNLARTATLIETLWKSPNHGPFPRTTPSPGPAGWPGLRVYYSKAHRDDLTEAFAHRPAECPGYADSTAIGQFGEQEYNGCDDEYYKPGLKSYSVGSLVMEFSQPGPVVPPHKNKTAPSAISNFPSQCKVRSNRRRCRVARRNSEVRTEQTP